MRAEKDTTKKNISTEISYGNSSGNKTQIIDSLIKSIAGANIKPGLTQANEDGSINEIQEP